MSTDPLADWTLERDVLRSDVRPHRLKSPDDSAVWLEAHEADQFERAKAITAAWAAGDEAQRFTAEVHMEAGTNGTGYAAWLYDGGRYIKKAIMGSKAECDAFAAQVNRPAPPADAHRVQPQPDELRTALERLPEWRALVAAATAEHESDYAASKAMADAADDLVFALAASPATEAPPADDLPEGVHRIDADTLVARGIDIPEGWDFYGPAESLEASEDESRPWWDWRDREADVRTGHVVYVVRRRPTPPPPAVERVPWWEAMTQELPIAEWGGQRIKHAKLQNSGMFLSTWGLYNVIRVDAADGTVEVLRQDGAA